MGTCKAIIYLNYFIIYDILWITENQRRIFYQFSCLINYLNNAIRLKMPPFACSSSLRYSEFRHQTDTSITFPQTGRNSSRKLGRKGTYMLRFVNSDKNQPRTTIWRIIGTYQIMPQITSRSPENNIVADHEEINQNSQYKSWIRNNAAHLSGYSAGGSHIRDTAILRQRNKWGDGECIGLRERTYRCGREIW